MSKKKISQSVRSASGGSVYQERYDDKSLVIFVDGTAPLPPADSLEERFSLVEKQIQDVSSQVNFPSGSCRLDDILSTCWHIGKNGVHTMPTFLDIIASSVEQAQLEVITRNDSVVLFFHGYYQSNGSAVQLWRDARKRGTKVVSVGYDYRMDPADFAANVLFPAIRRVLVRGGKIEGVIGHSTGADNVRYALLHDSNVIDYGVEQGTTYILSAPLTSGFREPLNLPQHLIRAVIPARDDIRTMPGKWQLVGLNQPLPDEVVTYTFLCSGDRLVTPRCGIDTNRGGLTVIVPGGGHFAGTGVSSAINQQYLDLIKERVKEQYRRPLLC